MAAKIIIILSEARTGSTFLCRLLNRFENTLDLQEVFNLNKDDIHGISSDFNKFLDKHYQHQYVDLTTNSSEFIDNPMKLLSLMSTYFKKTIIVKIHLYQLRMFSDKDINLILSSPNHKFILLNRSNFLELYVSLMIAGKSGQWKDEDTSNSMIAIDKNDFQNTLLEHHIKYTSIKKQLKDNNVDYLFIDYDLYLKNYNEQKFIDLLKPWWLDQGFNWNLSTNHVTSIKQNNSIDIADNISNYNELSDIVRLNNDGIIKVKIK